MSRIAIIGDNSIAYIDILLDIWNRGDSAILVDRHIPMKVLKELLFEAHAKECYVDEYLINELGDNLDIGIIPIKAVSNSATIVPTKIYDKFQSNYSKDEAIIIYSSGTTGKAKGIILSHYAINTNADSILDYMQLKESDTLYIVKPLFHSSTITGELLVGLKGKTKMIIAPVLVPPRYVFDNINRYAVTTICLNPTLLRLYANYVEANELFTLSLKTIYVSGSLLDNRLLQQAINNFDNIRLYNVYGLSEAGPRVSAQRLNCAHNNSVGKPIKGVSIFVINEEGEIAQTNEYGIVHISTPSLFSGYISGSTKHTSRYGNYLNSGDIGYIDDYGELNIVDRVDNVIIIDSHKIYPSDIENTVLKYADVDECSVIKIGRNNESYLACVYAGRDSETMLRYKLKDFLLPYEIPKQFVKCEKLPKNSNGKVVMEKVFSYIQSQKYYEPN